MYTIDIYAWKPPKFIWSKNAIFDVYGVLYGLCVNPSGKHYTHHTNDLNECFIEKCFQNIQMFRWRSHLRFLIENCCLRRINEKRRYTCIVPPFIPIVYLVYFCKPCITHVLNVATISTYRPYLVPFH